MELCNEFELIVKALLPTALLFWFTLTTLVAQFLPTGGCFLHTHTLKKTFKKKATFTLFAQPINADRHIKQPAFEHDKHCTA